MQQDLKCLFRSSKIFVYEKQSFVIEMHLGLKAQIIILKIYGKLRFFLFNSKIFYTVKKGEISNLLINMQAKGFKKNACKRYQ